MIGLLNDLLGIIKEFLTSIGIENWLVNQIIAILTLTFLLAIASNYIYKFFNWLRLRQQRRFLNRNLHPYFTPEEVDKATRYYIPTKFQETPPSQAHEPRHTFIDPLRPKLIPTLLKKAFNKDGHQHYIILADSGMGKTTFMINLYLSYKKQWKWWRVGHNIRLFPLGYPNIIEEILEIKSPENTILLLDAFDEDTDAIKDYRKRLEVILKTTQKFSEVVITCRTQFFPTQEEEIQPTGLFNYGGDGGERTFKKNYISIFDDLDVWHYLLKRYNVLNPLKWQELKRARNIVKKSPNLVVRPMLLSYIQDLVNEEQEYEYTYEIYEVLVNKWVEREANKSNIIKQFQSKEKFKEQLIQVSEKLALDLYENRKNRGGLWLPKEAKLKDTPFQISDLVNTKSEEKFNQSQWRSRSLLNRDAMGNYKFSHRSILEYFLANFMLNRPFFYEDFDFEGMDAAKDFLKEMVFEKIIKGMEGGSTINTFKALSSLEYKRLEKVSILKITNGTQTNITYLTLFSFDEIVILDLKIHHILHKLYVIYYLPYLSVKPLNWIGVVELRRLWNHLRLRELQELKELGEGRELVEKLKLWSLLERMEKLKHMERIELLKLRELIKQIKPPNLFEVQELINLLKNPNPEFIQELKRTNRFISQCQVLEKKMPNTKIYY